MSRRDDVEPNNVLAADFMDFITALNQHGVEFVLVGGYAVAVYGVVRATGDIDFFYRLTRANVMKLLAAMADFGAPKSCMSEAALSDPKSMTFFGQEPFRIDLLNSISGVSFKQAWENATEVELQGERLHVIGINDLIANKRASGRPKDVQDVRKLEKIISANERPARSTLTKTPAKRPRR